MKIFELLSGDTESPMQSMQQPDVAPMANVPSPMPATQPMQQPQQQAGLWDMAKDFMSTPQPLNGAKAAAPTPPTPSAPGQPPAQSSGMISRPFGSSAIGQNLDAINKGLQPK